MATVKRKTMKGQEATMKDLPLGEAFGAVDEGFLRAVTHALDVVEKQPSETVTFAVWHRRWVRLAVAVALACGLLVAGLAVADEYRRGVLDFFSGGGGASADGGAIKTDEAAELLVDVSGGESAQTDWATFEVGEYLYDGRWLFVTVNITAVSEDILLLTPGYGGASHPVQDMAAMKPYYATEQQSIVEYVAIHGLEVYRVDFDGGPPVDRFDGSMSGASVMQSWDDVGKLTLMVEVPLEPGQTEATLRFDMCPVDLEAVGPSALAEKASGTLPTEEETVVRENGAEYTASDDLVDDQAARQTVVLTLNIDMAYEATVLGLAEPVVFDEYGITIDEVRLTLTPLASYLMVCGTVDDESCLMADSSPSKVAAPAALIGLDSGEESQTIGYDIDGNGRYRAEAKLPVFNESLHEVTLTLCYDEESYPSDLYPHATSRQPETHTLPLTNTQL
ncbi:MAG: hypothetical protein LBL27_02330 [Coriobacteriales bacterium]|nr:hypothetical protein [Coriobacteriales bacterium]